MSSFQFYAYLNQYLYFVIYCGSHVMNRCVISMHALAVFLILIYFSISWICQVRLFLSEDSPSQAGLRPQDNLQAKGSWLMHAAGPSSDDSLPPGFESLQPTSDLKIDISQIPLIRWRCPPQVIRTCNLERCILLMATCQGDFR